MAEMARCCLDMVCSARSRSTSSKKGLASPIDNRICAGICRAMHAPGEPSEECKTPMEGADLMLFWLTPLCATNASLRVAPLHRDVVANLVHLALAGGTAAVQEAGQCLGLLLEDAEVVHVVKGLEIAGSTVVQVVVFAKAQEEAVLHIAAHTGILCICTGTG